MSNFRGKKIFVGLSGGVDSAVSAALLQQEGAEVVGIFMKNWAGEQGLQLDCPWQEDLDSAKAVAAHLDIEFASYNFEKEYKARVLDYFFREYEAGRTPNPDILCNSEIKFKAFLEKATAEGADYIATGHYAGKKSLAELGGQKLPQASEFLLRGADLQKDQSYFLSNLTSKQLARAVFPLAELTKPEVRRLALDLKLPNATRPDSQGICFIGDLDVQAFLRKYLARNPGEIRDLDTGKKVGTHEGLAFYTIGQREGLRIGGAPEPYYVAGKDQADNTLWVVLGSENPHLYKSEVNFTELHWLNPTVAAEGLLPGLELSASIRYRQSPQTGKFAGDKFYFSAPQRAVTPGQSIVFYHKDVCLGRGVIL